MPVILLAIADIPGVKKAAIGIGGRFGYEAAVCRTDNGEGPWGPPVMMSLMGACLRQDTKANEAIYGKGIDPRTRLLRSGQPIPPEAQGLVNAIDRLTSGKDPQ